ncbi:MAG: putative bifunctional diguanylate cyclase/phosphodiesterase, partial [Candidatus Limnocylindria bacterium]
LERAFAGLREVAGAIGRVPDPAEAATLAVAHARDLLGADGAAVFQWDAEAALLRRLAGAGSPRYMPPETLRPGEGLSGAVVERGEAIAAEDFASSPHVLPGQRAVLKSAVAVPLLVGRRAIGSLSVFFEERRAVSEDEIQVLSLFAAELAPTLEAGRLFIESERRRTEAEALARRLERLALFDVLTDLPNRSALRARIDEALTGARRWDGKVALLVLDIQHFKDINDAFGDDAGDDLLRQIAARLTEHGGAAATIARSGGDEFAVLLVGRDSSQAAASAQALIARLDEPFSVGGQTVRVAIRAGVAAYPDHGEDGPALLHCAEVAVGVARHGGGRIAVYAPEQDVYSPARLGLLRDLRAAIEGAGLTIHLQPVADLATGAVRSAEALARWQHPERGMIGPLEFLPLAERGGLMKQLTERVLCSALAQARAWREAELDISVSVNLSVQTLLDPDLPGMVERALAAAGLPPAALTLEITETHAMADAQQASDVLRALRSTGVHLAIDDFGTGYSSLAYLQRLSVDTVKIDRSFVMRMREDAGSAAIVRATIELSHSLGLGVVAEGVEDRETWDALLALGCDRAQGYYLSRPLPAGELTRWLRARSGITA